jgi:hypothetical protein
VEAGLGLAPDDGLFCGWAGVVVALRAWSRVAGDAAAASAAAQVTSRIAGRIVQAPAGRPECTDVSQANTVAIVAGHGMPASGQITVPPGYGRSSLIPPGMAARPR